MPFSNTERWRLDNSAKTVDELKRNLADLERILKLQQVRLESENPTGADATSIQGTPVVQTLPTNGQILTYDGGASGGTGWTPRFLLAGEGIDLAVDASTGNNTIIAEDASTSNRGILQLTGYLAGTATSPTVRDATSSLKGAIRLTNDLAGTADSPIVAGIQDNNVTAGTLTDTQLYRHNGTDLVAWSPKWMTANLSADQTTNLAAGGRIHFDTILEDSGHITLDTGFSLGQFTLPPGVWLIIVSPSVEFSASTGLLTVRVRDNSAGALRGHSGFVRPYTRATNDAAPHEARAIFVNTASALMEARIITSTSVSAIDFVTGITIAALA